MGYIKIGHLNKTEVLLGSSSKSPSFSVLDVSWDLNGIPTWGPSTWLGLPHNMVAVFQEQAS